MNACSTVGSPFGVKLGASMALACGLAGTAMAVPTVDAQGGPWLRIEMRPQVQVRQTLVRLGDVALLTSPDLALLKRAMSIPLGQAPRAGETVQLESERLGYWLRTRTGLQQDQIQWEGATATTVGTATRELPGEEVLAPARAALLARIKDAARQRGLLQPRIELEAVSVPSNVQVPVGEIVLRVRPGTPPALNRHMLIWVDVFVAEQHVRAVPVRFDVGIFALAPVATRELAIGSAIESDGIALREVNVAGLSETASLVAWAGDQTVEAKAPSLVRRHTPAGSVITEDRLQRAPTVARGDWVSLVTRNGLLSLESRAEVLQDGQVGQVVRARPVNGTGVLLARVVGPGQLESQP
ncbi:flagellar basal body P-ring formation chaperone FlgA [Acidovorax sp. NCPPB 2350]|nr:flagellar basal body P-ring formation chaperone FlgA [Acidovorax sp. NCPPB 2350]